MTFSNLSDSSYNEKLSNTECGVSSRPRDSSESRLQIRDVSSLALYRTRVRAVGNPSVIDAQRVCLQILKVSEESLGRDETPRQTSHEHYLIAYD